MQIMVQFHTVPCSSSNAPKCLGLNYQNKTFGVICNFILSSKCHGIGRVLAMYINWIEHINNEVLFKFIICNLQV